MLAKRCRKTSRRMLYTRLAMPILIVARAIPTVRMNNRILSFWAVKTCSTRERTMDLSAFARRVRGDIGRPGGFLRWIRLTNPFASRKASLALDR